MRAFLIPIAGLAFLAPGMPALADRPPVPEFRSRELTVRLSEDRTAIATVRVPRLLRPGQRVPVLLIFGGFESAGRVLDLLHPDIPIVLASFDYPFPADRRFRFPESLKWLPEAKRLQQRTVSGILDLTEQLKTLPEVDPRRIVVAGASFGAPFALAAAARSPDISLVVAVHGFGQVPRTAERLLARAWLPYLGILARPSAWTLSRLLWLYLWPESPEESASRLRENQTILLISADHDSFVPTESSDSLWAAIERSSASSSRVRMPTDHLMPGSEALIADIVARIEAWLRQVRPVS